MQQMLVKRFRESVFQLPLSMAANPKSLIAMRETKINIKLMANNPIDPNAKGLVFILGKRIENTQT
jgi:hypothetical protein